MAITIPFALSKSNVKCSIITSRREASKQLAINRLIDDAIVITRIIEQSHCHGSSLIREIIPVRIKWLFYTIYRYWTLQYYFNMRYLWIYRFFFEYAFLNIVIHKIPSRLRISRSSVVFFDDFLEIRAISRRIISLSGLWKIRGWNTCQSLCYLIPKSSLEHLEIARGLVCISSWQEAA